MKHISLLLLPTLIGAATMGIAECETGSEHEGMVRVEAGTFLMGICNEKTNPPCRPGDPGYNSYDYPDVAYEDEVPLHEVYLDAYDIDAYEVTVAAYRACVEAGACEAPGDWEGCNWGRSGYENHPVNCVGWADADTYCRYAGKRLPTEAEWEKASRGTQGQKYPWGNAPATCELANFIDSYDSGTYCVGETTPVGAYPAGVSPYGAYDMAGNVWEWVADKYGFNYYQVSPEANPQGPANGLYRVIRGGSWDDYPSYVRSANRDSFEPDSRPKGFGFRCAVTVAD